MFRIKRKQFQIPPEGCRQSPIDKRDVLMSEIYPLPVRIAPEMPPPFDLTILNQNGYPHCVGFSSAALKQEKELRERVSKVFDGDWIYKKCKELEGNNSPGTYLRLAMKVLQKQGAKPLNEPEEEAIKYRIGGYARVDDLSFEGLKKAIYINGAIIAGFTGSNQGWQTAYVRPPKPGEKTWGHAVLLIGYNKDYIIGQNSWGENWGDKGLFYIPKDYLPFEAWVILTDLPTEFLPSPQLEGWVASEYLKPSLEIGNKVYPYTRLNLRKEPGGEKITTLDIGQQLEIIGEAKKVGSYNWVKVRII